MKKLFIIVFMLMSGISTSFGQAFVNQYRVMNYLKNPYPNLVLLAAHRGLHYRYTDTPENSLKAISRAAENGVEAIEIDIKMTKDGVPILSHDDNLARMTYNGYNPFNATGALPTIPNISEQTFASVNNLRLRKINFHPTFGYPQATPNGFMGVQNDETVSSLATALAHIRNNNLRLVVMLDLKDVPTALACWRVVKSMTDCAGQPFSKTVIFKMSLKALGYQSPIQGLIDLGIMRRTYINNEYNLVAGGVNEAMQFVPVYNGNDIDKLVEFSARPPMNMEGFFDSIENTIRQYVKGYVYSEINSKYTSTYQSVFNHLSNAYSKAKSRGIFMPVQEVPKYNSTDNYGFYENTGRCCYQLSDVLYTSKWYGQSEISDPRTNIDNLDGHNVIITDAPMGAHDFLVSRQKRGVFVFRTNTDPCNTGSARLSAEETPVDDETKLLLFPNPSVDSFTLQYWADEATEANVKIINSVGQTAMEQHLNFEKGINQPTFNTTSFVGGTYFVNMEVDGKVITRKLMIVK